MLYTIVGMLVIILDQAVKFWVDKTINYTNPSIDLIPGVISLVRVQNDGAAFSFLAGGGARIWFIVLTLAFTLLVIIALATNFISGKFGRWCMVLVTAGGLANMIDRVLYGVVIDMFKIDLFDFAVFNVADIFITVFCIAFIIYILFGGEKEPELNEDEFDEVDEESEDRPKREKKKKQPKAELFEEEDVPVKKKKSSKKSAAYQPDDYEDDVKPKKKKPSSEEYDEYKLRKNSGDSSIEDYLSQDRRAAETREKAVASKASEIDSAYDSSDPFAEWERANAKVRDERNSSSVAKAMNTTTGARPVATKKTREQVVQTSSIEDTTVKKAKTDKASNKTSDLDMLDLDDILNEFK